jgi:4-amino-4-deoxy-L-arabinose transferase-like glycosyltransferase
LSPRQRAYAVLFITWLGFALRLYDLGSDSLWFDEILTARTAEDDLGSIWQRQAELSDHPPALYMLAHVSLELGHSEFALRLPGALLGVLAVPLLYRLARSWGEPRIGLWAALLLALSPSHVQFSQEARHYSPLSTLSLASLMVLYQGLERGDKKWWAAFGVATLLSFYTHYASFIVLALEVAFAALVLGMAWLKAREHNQPNANVTAAIGWLAVSLLIAGALYSPWIPHMLGHLGQNLGPEAARSTATDVSLTAWVASSFYAFGIRRWTAFLFGGLCLWGWLVNLRRRRWERAWLFLIWLTVPFFLIKFTDVRRHPFPKYVAYLLPIYLLGVATGIDALMDSLARLWPRSRRQVSGLLAALIALSLVLVSVPAIKQVYLHVERDWKGAVQTLSGIAGEGDVFITATLDLPDGFNQGWFSLPYYLEKVFDTFYLLPAAHIAPDLDELADAVGEKRNVWALILNRVKPMHFDNADFQVVPFRGQLFLVYPTQSEQTILDKSIALFEAFAPFALSPQPQRRILLDLAAMYNAAQRYEEANETLELVLSLDPAGGSKLHRVAGDTYHGLLKEYVAAKRMAEARAIAWKLLALDSKDKAALQALTVYDFIARLPEAEINAAQGPFEHVDTRTFTMPQTGDWQPVLFMHPSSKVSYSLTLPETAVELQFSAAMAPESWDWGGDGSTFVVRLQSEDGEVHELFSQHVGNDPGERRWHHTTIDLSPFAGQDVVITLSTGPGPQGDFSGDWAGWASPRIVWSPDAP